MTYQHNTCINLHINICIKNPIIIDICINLNINLYINILHYMPVWTSNNPDKNVCLDELICQEFIWMTINLDDDSLEQEFTWTNKKYCSSDLDENQHDKNSLWWEFFRWEFTLMRKFTWTGSEWLKLARPGRCSSDRDLWRVPSSPEGTSSQKPPQRLHSPVSRCEWNTDIHYLHKWNQVNCKYCPFKHCKKAYKE